MNEAGKVTVGERPPGWAIRCLPSLSSSGAPISPRLIELVGLQEGIDQQLAIEGVTLSDTPDPVSSLASSTRS